ncbi:hypothetical protein [Mycoplasma todarodis]|uniref:Uncharacterized protein n=1 Tax=Mycoplasma todarodis TaxID=1937191 RepID=A0A4R0XLA3_9MOLU|nr:hypothetical protein [Mycoplasma todarodis]TCG11446.1 hypothetical protein C4B25_01515 [Mycoplasma todarodis]
MNAKTKSIINIVVASLAVLAFVLFVITIVKTLGFLTDNAFEMMVNKDGTIKKVSPEAWKLIHDGGVIKGADATWAGSKTGSDVKDVAAFQTWLADHVESIAKALKKDKLQPYQIDGLVLQNKEYQATIGGIELLLLAFKSSTVSALLKVTFAVSFITWIAGIVTSIIVKKARKELGIVSGGANVVFAIIRVTGIPFLITSIMTHVAISKALKNK